MALKLFRPYVSYRAIINVIRILLGTQLAEGKEVQKFESEFATKYHVKNVVALNSGSSALELAYELAGLTVGDEVITPVLTCTATNIPLLHKGVKIVFADIDYDLNINIEDVKRKITKKTKAIVFVHFGGNNRGLRDIIDIGKQYNITIIEDAAQAVGSDVWGKSDYTAISLQAIKTLTSGDGGIIICKRDKDYKKAKRLRWFGYDREEKQKKGDTDLKEAGYKYHMNNITAAIGRGNLKAIDKVIAKRKKLADFYNSYGIDENINHSQQLDRMFFEQFAGSEKYPLFKRVGGIECHAWLCIQWGVQGEQHHYRNDKYTIFKQFKNHCPVMDEVENKWRLLPFHHKVSFKQAKKAIHEIH